MNNVWKKYKERVTPYEFNTMLCLEDIEWDNLENTFGKHIEKYSNFLKGKSSIPEDSRPLVICGDRIQLIKAKGYIFLKMHDFTRYTTYTIGQILTFNPESDIPTFVDCPGLAILYLDKNMNDYGKFEKWNDSCILSNITERSRKENATVILSEIDLEDRIKDSGEFNSINLFDPGVANRISSESNARTLAPKKDWEA